jgi:hypothetical protein
MRRNQRDQPGKSQPFHTLEMPFLRAHKESTRFGLSCPELLGPFVEEVFLSPLCKKQL